MRTSLVLFPLLLCASPALAREHAVQVPPELTDPTTAQKLGNVMQVLSNAVLDMRVGEVQAAIQGRPATPAERNMTVRDIARRDDPNFDRHLQQQMANVGPRMQQGMKALNQAIPPLMQGIAEARQALERAVANMPDPNYPKR